MSSRMIGMACAAGLATGPVAMASDDDGGTVDVHFCSPDAHGRLSGGIVTVERMDIDHERAPASFAGAAVTTILDNGDPADRIDLVTVGDGYLASELGSYASHVTTGVNALFEEPPFDTYKPFFNVHRVDVISNESGVDNDPSEGVNRDTALDMAFFCSGIERLLCVNTGAALAFAANAPDVDQVFAIANSSKYGGAGYTTLEIGTFAGGNGSAPEIAIHELGHSLGNLADEYTYGGPTEYQGGEPSAVNVSIFDSNAMASMSTKWAAWLNVFQPGLGAHSTFEGGQYSEQGIYRPTNDSKMRSLGQPFNYVSQEALILEFYSIVDPIDGYGPVGGAVGTGDTVWVQPVQPVDHSLDVVWEVNGEVVPGQSGTTLAIDDLDLGPGTYTLKATVTDNTTLVRDEEARMDLMTQFRFWGVLIEAAGCPADCSPPGGNGLVNVDDLLAVINAFSTGDLACDVAPANGDGTFGNGVINFDDIVAVVNAFGPCS